MIERLLKAAELGELLGLSSETVLNRFQRGDLPGFRLYGHKGGPVRFRLSEIEVALDRWRVETTSRKQSNVEVVSELDNRNDWEHPDAS